MAKVPSSVANRLGQDLTPAGGEKAGSRSGIPAWTGRAINASRLLAGYDGGSLPDPYAGDKKLYTVSPDNMNRYAKVTSDGQKKMLETYATYRMNVYPSRRSCALPDFVNKGFKRNAMVGKLADGGNGISEAFMSSPFPIPNSGLEIVWNHTLRYRGLRLARDFNSASPTRGGDYTLNFTRDEIVFPFSDP